MSISRNAEGPSFPSQHNEDTVRMECSFYFFLLYHFCASMLHKQKIFLHGEWRDQHIYTVCPAWPQTAILLLILKITVLQLICCRFSLHFITLFCFSRCLCYVMLDDRITWDILRLTEKCLPWFLLRHHIFMESQKLEIVKVIRAHPVWMLNWHSFLSLWKLLVVR